LIVEGRVRVNRKVVREPGTRVDPELDNVVLDGRKVARDAGVHRTIALHKPRGYICTASRREGRTIYDLIEGMDERLVPAGRLDKNSEGLLLLSNDGDLVHRMTHPRFGCEKTYRVTVSGLLNPGAMRTLRSRLVIEGYRIRPANVRVLRRGEKPGRVLLEIVLCEGRRQQIRQMCAQAGLRVHRLVRVRVGNLHLAGLKPGQWRELDREELEALK